MMPNLFIHDGKTIDYTPVSDVAAGEVVKLEALFGVAPLPIPAGKIGSLQVDGSFDIEKAGGAINPGNNLFWDDTNKEVTTDVDNGNNEFIGFGAVAAAAPDLIARVLLSHRVIDNDIGYVPPFLDLLAWWAFRRTDSLDVSVDNDPISDAEDLSINTNDATQTTTSMKPLLKLGIKNGNAVGRFDGIDDYMAPGIDNGHGPGYDPDFDIDDYSIFIVTKQNAVKLHVMLQLQGRISGTQWGTYCFFATNGSIAINNSKAGVWHQTASSAGVGPSGSWMLVTFVKSGSTVSIYKDGALVARTTDAPVIVGRAVSAMRTAIGCGTGTFGTQVKNYVGDEGEILVYDQPKTYEQLDEIFDGLGEEWAIVVRGNTLITPIGNPLVTSTGLRLRAG